MLYVDWSFANQLVAATIISLVILPIVILAWVFRKHPEEESDE